MNRFHDLRFHGFRLVCRLRRGSAAGLSPNNPTLPESLATRPSNDSPATSISPVFVDELAIPTIVGGVQTKTPPAARQDGNLVGNDSTPRVSEKFFILKSLTVQDLEASLQNGIWTTQSQNEKALNEAYNTTDYVYLVFSANKSGEYFGYARMASIIASASVNLSATSQQSETPSASALESIFTSATVTACQGLRLLRVKRHTSRLILPITVQDELQGGKRRKSKSREARSRSIPFSPNTRPIT